MRERLGGKVDPMTSRRCAVEHPFGTLEARMGHTHFLTRRLKNVSTEMALNVLAYNIKRVVALIGIRGIIEGCRALSVGVTTCLERMNKPPLPQKGAGCD